MKFSYDRKNNLYAKNALNPFRTSKKLKALLLTALASAAFSKMIINAKLPDHLVVMTEKLQTSTCSPLNKYDNSIKIAVIDSGFNLDVLEKNFSWANFIKSSNAEFQNSIDDSHGTMVTSSLLEHMQESQKLLSNEYHVNNITIIPIAHQNRELSDIFEEVLKYKPQIINICVSQNKITDQNYKKLLSQLNYAKENNIIVVGSAGNIHLIQEKYQNNDTTKHLESKYTETFPAIFPSVFAVGSAKAEQAAVSEFNRDNGSIDVLDVGEKITVLNNKGEKLIVDGTSFSTPRVTALFASLINIYNKQNINVTSTQLENLVVLSSQKLNSRDRLVDIKSAFDIAQKGIVPQTTDIEPPHVLCFKATSKNNISYFSFNILDQNKKIDASNMSISISKDADDSMEIPVKYNYFNGRVSFQLKDLQSGPYIIYIRNIKDSNGNVLSCTKRMFGID